MKKILRVVAMGLLVLLLGFLSLGLFYPSVTYQTEGKINRPVEEVFAFYNDVDKLQEWIPEIKSIEKLKLTPEKVGSEYRMVVLNNGQKTEMLQTITDYELNKKVVAHFDAGMMQKDDAYLFVEKDGETIIHGNHIVEGDSYYSRCVFVLFKGPFQSIDQGYMDNFIAWASKH